MKGTVRRQYVELGEFRACHFSSEPGVLLRAGQAARNHVVGGGSWASERAGRLRGSRLGAPGLLQLIQHVACEARQVQAPSLQEEHTEGRQKRLHDSRQLPGVHILVAQLAREGRRCR